MSDDPLGPMHHDRPDPNICPGCGHEDTIRECAKRYTWQPVKLGYASGPDAVDIPIPANYERFETSDDTTDETYECGDCFTAWPSLADLAHAQRVVKALTDHRDFWETRAERLKDLANADRLDTVDGAERIATADAAGQAFAHALEILQGNGEA